MTDKWIEFFVIIGLVFLVAWILIYFTNILPERNREKNRKELEKLLPEETRIVLETIEKIGVEEFFRSELERLGLYKAFWKEHRKHNLENWMTLGQFGRVACGLMDETVELLEKGKYHD